MITVENISWLSKEAREAEVRIRGSGATALVFSHPCSLNEGQKISVPLHAFNASEIQISESQEERVENLKGLSHFVQGKLIDLNTPIVSAKGFLIQIDDYLPGGIKRGDFVCFKCGRIDYW